MHVFYIWLRRSRMLLWGGLAVCANLLMGFFAIDNWIDSYSMVSIWPAIGMAYCGSLVAAGAADSERTFLSSSFPVIERFAYPSRVILFLARYIPFFLYGAVLPVLIPSCVEYGVVFFAGNAHGSFTVSYLLTEILFLTFLCFVGMIVARLIDNRIYAILIALLVAFVLGAFVDPTPPNNDAWLVISLSKIFITVGMLLFSCVLYMFISSLISRGAKKRLLLGSISALSIVVLAYFSHSMERQEPRSEGEKVCKTSADATVCVWKEDEYLLPRLLEITERGIMLERLVGDELKAPSTLSEPYLDVEDSQIVTPYGEGDGMWLVADTVATEMLLDHVNGSVCNLDEMNTIELEELVRLSWVTNEMVTGFIYGDKRPESVVISDNDIRQKVKSGVENFYDMNDEEQVALIKENLGRLHNCVM